MRKPKEPRIFAGRMHDMRGPFGSILSVCCEGPDCEICAKERAKIGGPFNDARSNRTVTEGNNG